MRNNKIVINRHYNDINPEVCGEQACKPSYSYGPAVRSYWLLHFVVSGKGMFKTRNGEYSLKKGDVFIIRPNEVTYYCADEEDPWTYMWIGFSGQLPPPKAIASNDVIYAPYLYDIFRAAIDMSDMSQDSRGYEARLCAKIWEIRAVFEDQETSSGEVVEEYIRSALNIMDGEYLRGITVEEVADRLHLNRSYFTKLFGKVMRTSPREYLASLRMNKAAELLCEGFGVSVVAASVGYPDVFSFSRAFKNHYGLPPTEYVKTKRH